MRNSPFRPRYRPQERQGVAILSSTEIAQELTNVPHTYRGLFADTLVDWFIAARNAGEDPLVLGERVAEINRAFHQSKEKVPVLVKALVDTLTHEVHEYESIARELEAEKEHQRDTAQQDGGKWRIWKDQQEFGQKHRSNMAHRAGLTGKTPPKVVKRW